MKTARNKLMILLLLGGVLNLSPAAGSEPVHERLGHDLRAEQLRQLRARIGNTLMETRDPAVDLHRTSSRQESKEPNGHALDYVTIPFPQKRVSFSPR